MQQVLRLETVVRHAPLGLRFIDFVRNVSIPDGLEVSAWPVGAPLARQRAIRSPMTGVHGFHTLPGLRGYEVGDQPFTDWCASPPNGVGLGESPDLESLRDLFEAGEGGPIANFAVAMEDRRGRFLPLVMLMCLPKDRLVEVPLFSAPARTVPAGMAAVRGEIRDRVSDRPASWALVTASPNGMTYVGMSDARGMFELVVPYAGALPPLVGSPPGGATGIGELSWPLTVQVYYEPTAQRRVDDAEPPDVRSILEQAPAAVYHTPSISGPTLTRELQFGHDLLIATQNESRLLIDAA